VSADRALFPIPGSTNTWQTVIEAAGEGKMLDPEDVSGLVYIDTVFFDDDKELASFVVRIHYDGKECQS
jgi:retinal rod rhodopsin-sensitive cGMP 3',5'-cyclic phosphodiesterase subunit delta